MIEKFAQIIPESLLNISGSVFYSGRKAFSGNKRLYLLGINPGGSVEDQEKETIKWHTDKVLLEYPANWSAYKDESWRGNIPGTHGLQPRILHLLKNLDLSPHETPASNVVFVRSSREKDIKDLYQEYAEKCWPVHEKIILVLLNLKFAKIESRSRFLQGGEESIGGKALDFGARHFSSVSQSR